ncbi:hypothetical protein VYU27_007823 [Nannochloropsis oceanica]
MDFGKAGADCEQVMKHATTSTTSNSDRANLAPSPVLLTAACRACRSIKIKCDRSSWPCERCTRLELECKPQERGRGRPRGSVTVGETGGREGRKGRRKMMLILPSGNMFLF